MTTPSPSPAIGILCFLGSPLGIPCGRELRKLGFHNIHFIFDGYEPNEKLMKIIRERTEGKAALGLREDYAKEGFQCHFVDNHNSDETLKLMDQLKIEVLASCGTPRKISARLFQAPRLGLINCHPGRLPDYRGSSAVEWALSSGDQVAVTAHFMEQEYDAGPIIKVYPFETSGLTYTEIRTQIIPFQARAIADAVRLVLEKNLPPSEYAPQGEGFVRPVFPAERMDELKGRIFS